MAAFYLILQLQATFLRRCKLSMQFAVRATLLRKAEKTSSRITEVERKSKKGTVFYDCELKNEDVEFELKVLEDGRIVEVDHESVDWEDLPAKVREGILSASGDASITCVKRTRHEGRSVFKAETVDEQGEGRMVLVDPEGARIER